MTAEYKLIHFNTRFLAEPIRFIFAYAGVPYEDVRLGFDEWNRLKDKEGDALPWRQLPILELSDGRRIGQSSAISAYLAKKFELCGLDDWDATRCKEISDAMRDVRQEWRKFFFQKNNERIIQAKASFIELAIPKYFGWLSKMLDDAGGVWLVCDVVTWADLVVAQLVGFLQDTVDPTVLDAYPNILEHKKRVWELPAIKNWLNVRPKPDVAILRLIPTTT